jgi:hypothetical protein
MVMTTWKGTACSDFKTTAQVTLLAVAIALLDDPKLEI